jgi:hypothetical protein
VEIAVREGSKKGRTSDMVGCYTDATNLHSRGGFYRLVKAANGGNTWREKMVGKNSRNKWREKWRENCTGKLMQKITAGRLN